MAIFVPFSQRLLGVRFGLVRLALGAALTLAVFSPIAERAGRQAAVRGLQRRRGRVPRADRGLLDAGRPGLPGAVRGPGADRVVAPGPRSAPRPERPDRAHPALPADPPDRDPARPRPVPARPPPPRPRERRRPGRAGPLAPARPRRGRRHVRQARPGAVHPQRHHPAPRSPSELSRLQDQVSPAPWPEIEQVLTEELGASPHHLYADFDTEPLAAASVAQVYTARLPDGPRVVVKVQRPGIATVVDRDLDIVTPARPAARAEHRLGPLDGRPRARRRVRRRDARGARLHRRGRQHDHGRGRPIRCRQQ